MILKLFEPAYYRNHYPVEPEIKELLSSISEFYLEKKYSDLINKVSLTMAIAPDEIFNKGLWKEEVKCWQSSGDAYVSSRINFNQYINSSVKEKQILLIATILKSIYKIKKRGKINYSAFETDMIAFCENHDIDVNKLRAVLYE